MNWRLATGIQAPAGTCKIVNIAMGTNYQMLHVFVIQTRQG